MLSDVAEGDWQPGPQDLHERIRTCAYYALQKRNQSFVHVQMILAENPKHDTLKNTNFLYMLFATVMHETFILSARGCKLNQHHRF